MPAQMDMHRRVPFLQRGGNEHAVAHDPGIVDDHMQVTKCGHGGIDDAFCRVPIGDVLIIGDGLAARRLDFRHHRIGSAGIAPFARKRSADIIDHHIRALSAEGRAHRPAPARARRR